MCLYTIHLMEAQWKQKRVSHCSLSGDLYRTGSLYYCEALSGGKYARMYFTYGCHWRAAVGGCF